MTHINRSKIIVDTSGDWRLYTSWLPDNCKILGIVTAGGISGALISLQTSSGLYKMVARETVQALNDRKVEIALEAARSGKKGGRLGGGKRAEDGKVGMMRKNITIDKESADILLQFGSYVDKDGNTKCELGLGIRRAAEFIKKHQK